MAHVSIVNWVKLVRVVYCSYYMTNSDIFLVGRSKFSFRVNFKLRCNLQPNVRVLTYIVDIVRVVTRGALDEVDDKSNIVSVFLGYLFGIRR